jgi:hypothetical protein
MQYLHWTYSLDAVMCFTGLHEVSRELENPFTVSDALKKEKRPTLLLHSF